MYNMKKKFKVTNLYCDAMLLTSGFSVFCTLSSLQQWILSSVYSWGLLYSSTWLNEIHRNSNVDLIKFVGYRHKYHKIFGACDPSDDNDISDCDGESRIAKMDL